MTNDVKVLYIGGYSRSGSTLFSLLLDQIEGFVAVGELWDIWQRSFTENQLSGTGKPFRECEFWTAVVREAYGGFEKVDVQEMQRLRTAVQSKQHIPMLIMPMLRTPAFTRNLQEYSAALSQLYCAIQKVSGCNVIVDSSKVPTYAYLLRDVPRVDLRIVHLVRDSRATAYSWQRKKIRPEIHWKTQYMDRYSVVRSSMEWNVMNGLFYPTETTDGSYMRIRYEDMVLAPQETLQMIVKRMGEDIRCVPNFNDHTFETSLNYTVSGNPDRFKQGTVKIRPDTEWLEEMNMGTKIAVSLLTWPLLLRYAYLSHAAATEPLPHTPPEATTQPVTAK